MKFRQNRLDSQRLSSILLSQTYLVDFVDDDQPSVSNGSFSFDDDRAQFAHFRYLNTLSSLCYVQKSKVNFVGILFLERANFMLHLRFRSLISLLKYVIRTAVVHLCLHWVSIATFQSRCMETYQGIKAQEALDYRLFFTSIQNHFFLYGAPNTHQQRVQEENHKIK